MTNSADERVALALQGQWPPADISGAGDRLTHEEHAMLAGECPHTNHLRLIIASGTLSRCLLAFSDHLRIVTWNRQGITQSTPFNYDDIITVEFRSNKAACMVTVVTAGHPPAGLPMFDALAFNPEGNGLIVEGKHRHATQKAVEELQVLMRAPRGPVAVGNAPANMSDVSALEQLRANGVITDDEHNTLRQRLAR